MFCLNVEYKTDIFSSRFRSTESSKSTPVACMALTTLSNTYHTHFIIFKSVIQLADEENRHNSPKCTPHTILRIQKTREFLDSMHNVARIVIMILKMQDQTGRAGQSIRGQILLPRSAQRTADRVPQSRLLRLQENGTAAGDGGIVSPEGSWMHSSIMSQRQFTIPWFRFRRGSYGTLLKITRICSTHWAN